MMIFRKGKTNVHRKKNLKVPPNKLVLIIGIVVFGLLIGGGFFYKQLQDRAVTTVDPATNEDINFGPPTDQELKETEAHKAQLSAPTGNTPKPSSATVTPIITSWGQSNEKVEVAARVPGILEDDGLCTLTLKRGDETRTGSSNAMANVSEVSCGFIAIPRSSLTAGEWSAAVTYSSPKSSGTSEVKKIAIE